VKFCSGRRRCRVGARLERPPGQAPNSHGAWDRVVHGGGRHDTVRTNPRTSTLSEPLGPKQLSSRTTSARGRNIGMRRGGAEFAARRSYARVVDSQTMPSIRRCTRSFPDSFATACGPHRGGGTMTDDQCDGGVNPDVRQRPSPSSFLRQGQSGKIKHGLLGHGDLGATFGGNWSRR